MVFVSEVNAGLDLVVKLTTFAAQLNDGWYKGSAEVDGFRDKVWTLSAKHAQWNDQLRRYGISENQHLLRLIQAADEALEKQQQYVLKLQKSWLLRYRKKVFPVQLSYYLDQLLEIVDAGPQLLAASVANSELLERHMAQTPVPLPFGPDANYVPMEDSILEVREALENPEGPRVVTVYGGPGMGKSMLAKYLALHYQEDKRRRSPTPHIPLFLDGVVYLSCGQKAGDRVKQIQLELLESLGFGIRSQTPTDSTGVSGVQEGDYLALPSHQTKLRSRLAEQKLLIILDDLWEDVVLQEVLVPAKGVKYLVTSQLRDIYISAKKIQIKRPTGAEASHIMANYTDGLPKRGEFPYHIKAITDDIIETLEFHPLSLANIGISINRSRATDRHQWDVIRKDLYLYLDENDFHSPPAYDRRYNLAVSASMMVMIESLPVEARRLLFLMALLEGQQLPEPLVKFFYSFIQADHFVFKYIKHERFLENTSLIDLTRRGDRSILDTHSLRSRYIREKRDLEVMSMGSEILMASGHQDTDKAIERGDRQETLVTVLSAMFYHESFKDAVASTLEKHVKVFNDGIIPRRLNTDIDTLDLVKNVRKHKHRISGLVWLLNADRKEENWKQQAHEYAKKIIVKFVYQGKLDDGSMARLLQLPQTTSIACDALCSIYDCHYKDFYDRDITFSSVHGEPMQALLTLFHNDTISMKLRTAVMRAVLHTLDYEKKETILNLAPKYKKFLAMDSNSFMKAFSPWPSYWRGGIMMAEFPGLLEDIIMALLLSENDHKLRVNAGSVIRHLSGHKPTALRIADTPNALRVLFDLFLSDDDPSEGFYGWTLAKVSGDILSQLSIVPDNRMKFGEVEDVWQGLGGIIAKLEGLWRATREEQNRWKLVRRASVAIVVLGYLALEESFKETIASLPGIREGLLFWQSIEIARQYTRSIDERWFMGFYGSTRALTILYSDSLDPVATDLPLLVAVLEAFPCEGGRPLKATTSFATDECYFSVYWTRVLAYIQMGSYAEALTNLYLAQHHLDLIPKPIIHKYMKFSYCQISSLGFFQSKFVSAERELRSCRMFLLAMLEDYPEAFLSAPTRLDQDEKLPWPRAATIVLAERGVLERLTGDLQRALDSFNAFVMQRQNFSVFDIDRDVLWHRGYVKYLMGDKAGAKEDAESAQLKLNGRIGSTIEGEGNHLWMLRKLPVHYMGFSSETTIVAQIANQDI